MRELEKILKAMANRRRLAILKHLKRNRRATVGDIAIAIKLSFRSTSKHLGILAAAELVDKVQVGLQVFYSLTNSASRAARTLFTLV